MVGMLSFQKMKCLSVARPILIEGFQLMVVLKMVLIMILAMKMHLQM